MSDENLYEFVSRRKRELIAQLAAMGGQMNLLHGQMAQREVELAEVERIEASLPGSPPTSRTAHYAPVSQSAIDLGLYERMTIKQLVVQALIDHFQSGGPAMSIRDFIHDAYGRDVLPSSLRPQLHRLKAAGILTQHVNTDTWDFQDGKRENFALYHHPRTTGGSPELQDDPSPTIEELEKILDGDDDSEGERIRRQGLLYGDKPNKD